MATWRRKRKRVNWGAIEYGWNTYEEKEGMAVGGSVTAAYRCQVSEYKLTATSTSAPRNECANVEAAVAILERGEACTVASADIPQLRQRLAGLGVA
jgi:hypothetical protein